MGDEFLEKSLFVEKRRREKERKKENFKCVEFLIKFEIYSPKVEKAQMVWRYLPLVSVDLILFFFFLQLFLNKVDD